MEIQMKNLNVRIKTTSNCVKLQAQQGISKGQKPVFCVVYLVLGTAVAQWLTF